MDVRQSFYLLKVQLEAPCLGSIQGNCDPELQYHRDSVAYELEILSFSPIHGGTDSQKQ